MNDYDELIEHCRNMYELGFGKMDAVADTLEQLVKDRDAAIKDLFEEADSNLNTCLYCKKDADCVLDCDNALWEWRGVTDECL